MISMLRLLTLVATMLVWLAVPAWAAPSASSCRDEGPDLVVAANTANTVRSKNLADVVAFIDAGGYRRWAHDPTIRPTGEIFRKTDGGLLDGSTHHRVRVYYSPRVAEWLAAGRPTPEQWAKQGQKPECYLPDGATIIKEMYQTLPPTYPAADPVIGWSAMVRKNGASHDGWYWVIYFKPEFRSMETMGTFSYSFCYTCHASTKGESTFADLENLEGRNAQAIDGRSYLGVAEPSFYTNLLSSPSDSAKPRASINPDFAKLFADPAIYPSSTGVPRYEANITGPVFPNTDYDHVWNRSSPADNSYLTSDNCIGCHDATALVDTYVPNMLIRRPVKDPVTGQSHNELLNLSVYGEWRASPMGMAGRDPIFYAQLESELNTYPEKAGDIQNICLSCHGALGQRQFVAEKGASAQFKLNTLFKTEGEDAHFGALARDGISCMVCHQMDPATVSAKDHTGKFMRGPANVIYGSSPPDSENGPIRTWPMQHALGLTPVYDSYLNKGEACAVCHTIVLPVETPGGGATLGKAHEQETFLEWYYSGYQTSNPAFAPASDQAQTCQDCHMNATFQGNGQRVNFKVANVENASWPIPKAQNLAAEQDITVPPRPEAGRHTLFGMNLFVLTLYDQFRSLFGLLPDSNPPGGTTDSFKFALDNGDWQVRNATADVKIIEVKRDGAYLNATVRITNKAGHRLPSGVGFRRAWIEFSVTDREGKLLWASGHTDANGVLVQPDGKPLASEFTDDYRKLQPHWKEITRQDQVQIYEERYAYVAADGSRILNTSFLGINEVVKDNRLLPRGYHYDYLLQRAGKGEDGEKYSSLLPSSNVPKVKGSLDPRDDPDYTNGSGTDTLTYRIPVAAIRGATAVQAQLNYQSTPPYYLRERFTTGKTAGGSSEQTQRLYYLLGHVDLEGSKVQGWKVAVQQDRAAVPQ